MTTAQPVNWRLRIGLILSIVLGAAWGFMLGWMQIRVNAWLSPWLVVGVAMPLAFAGSMIVGLVFNRMVQSWHKLARVATAVIVVALAVPAGLVWELFEQGYNAFQLLFESGTMAWTFEWLIAALGLFAGMWPRWTIPFARLFAGISLWFLSIPFGFLRRNRQPAAQTSAPASRPVQSMASQPTTQPERLVAPLSVQPRRDRRSIAHRTRLRKPKAKPAQASNGNGNGARIVAHVEDRCPYCFDIVKRNDPRGVKVCEVCGTPHHADCWAVTGKCQVPHLNT